MNEKNDQRPIVCGTDFSPTAVEATDIAAAIAKKLETKLVLVHVNTLHGILTADPGLLEAALFQQRAEIHREVKRLRETGLIVEEKLRAGSAFDEIVTTALETKARLVVVGAVGHGLTRRLFVGSVAERTAETSPIPTLVVRPDGGLLAWLKGERPLEVLVAYDFSSASDAALRWVDELGSIGELSVTVVHIDLPNEQHPAEEELTARAAKILTSTHPTVRLVPCWGNCEGALFETAAGEDVDLVVVGTHQRQGFERIRLGSVSRAVLHHATRSVAVVPPAHEKGATQ